MKTQTITQAVLTTKIGILFTFIVGIFAANEILNNTLGSNSVMNSEPFFTEFLQNPIVTGIAFVAFIGLVIYTQIQYSKEKTLTN